MINTRIPAGWTTTKPIGKFSCTPRVQKVHTKAEVVNLTPGLLGLGVLFNFEMYCETYEKTQNHCSLDYDQTDCIILLFTTCTRSTSQTCVRTPYSWPSRLMGIIQF